MTNKVGRPKKENPQEYTHNALGTYQDPVTQKWHLVNIKFNPILGEISEDFQDVNVEDSRTEIAYRFKIAASQLEII